MMDTPRGRILTFYSYKGGAGRSMALANVAWILASCGKRVLAVDWDLEAPGLHRYFQPFLIDRDLGASTGVIDFVIEYASEAIKPQPSGAPLPEDWYVEQADILRHALSLEWDFPSGGMLDFIPAGRQSASYAARVNSFDWQNFYDRLGGGRVLNAAADHMCRGYDYILIDSRTGVSDTAGICTVQLPDSLAVCFTYNNQSIGGAAAVARSVHEQRLKRSDREFKIFPIPMRVDASETETLNARRRYGWRAFDPVIGHIAAAERNRYWNEVEVPYVPIFAYEELLASFRESPDDPKTVLAAMLRATLHLTGEGAEYSFPISPERKRQILAEFAGTPEEASFRVLSLDVWETPAEEQARLAESLFADAAPDEKEAIRAFFGRLVRVPGSIEESASGFSRLRVRLQDLGTEGVVRRFVEAGLLRASFNQPYGEEMVELAHDSLVETWQRLHGWIVDDLAFLSWRQRLREQIRDWESHGQKSDYLLQGSPLRTALKWLGDRGGDLNSAETAFIHQSSALEKRPGTSQASRMRAVVIRPFGMKEGIDFDRVARGLIGPALMSLNFAGGDTIDILRAGSIRTDMIQRLLTADLVVADLSIHHANVFYELGIRHALRARRTFLLHAERDSYPFDLRPDRYLAYDPSAPEASLASLVAALRSTAASDDQDSPVFRSLPFLREQGSSRILAVPVGFREEAELAEAARRSGDLGLLAAETSGFEWQTEGLRMVGRSLFKLRDFRTARSSWETVRRIDQADVEANTLLGTIYRWLDDLQSSDEALQRVVADRQSSPEARAEASTLVGRNAKARWKNDWFGSPGDSATTRRYKALRSPYLDQSYQAYERAFGAELNYFHSGVSALTMVSIQIELARALPETWGEAFETASEAANQLGELQVRRDQLAAAVALSLAAAQTGLRTDRRSDPWVELIAADLLCVTSKRPPRVADAYRRALAGADPFIAQAAHDQLCLYQLLDIFSDNCRAAMAALGSEQALQPCEELPAPAAARSPRVLLFTGHRIDAPGRSPRRFPPDMEDTARKAIRRAIERELQGPGGVAGGIAGGASGGDILFHEVCAELGIATQIFLTLPRWRYIEMSVRPAGARWSERFDHLIDSCPTRVLADSEELPGWLAEKPGYSIWQRSNLWMLHNALAQGEVGLIALWDRQPDEDKGGPGGLVESAREQGAEVTILDTRAIFGLKPKEPDRDQEPVGA